MANNYIPNSFQCPNILIDDYDAVFKIVEASDHWTAAPAASRAAIERNPKLKVIPGADIIPPLHIGFAHRKQWTPVPSADQFLSLQPLNQLTQLRYLNVSRTAYNENGTSVPLEDLPNCSDSIIQLKASRCQFTQIPQSILNLYKLIRSIRPK